MLHPTLDLLAYIRFPFIEHIENLLFGFVLFSTIITTCIYIWGSKETLLRIIPNASEKWLTLVIVAVVFAVSWIPPTLTDVEKWLNRLIFAQVGLSFALPLFLILLLIIQGKSGGKINA
jgi:Mn2+/Fe2+ NRAMP family transporter